MNRKLCVAIIDPYDERVLYFEDTRKSHNRKKIYAPVFEYKRMVSKIPQYYRFDAESHRPLMTPFQHDVWLGESLTNYTRLSLSDPSYAVDENLSRLPMVEAESVKESLENPNATAKNLLHKVSNLRPNGLTTDANE